MSLLSEKILQLRGAGVAADYEILRALLAPQVSESAVNETVTRPAGVVALETAAVEAILALANIIQPGMTLAQVQAAPMTSVLSLVRAKFATLSGDAATALLAKVGELQTLHAAITAAGGRDWRAPDFAASTETRSRTERVVGPSWWAAHFPGEPAPSLHDIRTALQELNP